MLFIIGDLSLMHFSILVFPIMSRKIANRVEFYRFFFTLETFALTTNFSAQLKIFTDINQYSFNVSHKSPSILNTYVSCQNLVTISI